MVLFLFVIMMLNLNTEGEQRKSSFMRIAAIVSGGMLMVVLIASLKSSATLVATTDSNTQIGLVKTLGKALFTDFLFPFEISSLLFLSAMIGSVYLGKKNLS